MNKTEVLAWLERTGTKATLDGMARYGIEAKHAYGVPMGVLLKKSRELGKDHPLALALWDTGCYEARLLAALIGDPRKLTRAQMNAWAKSFENWADGDTACFKLFDQTPLAWEMVRPGQSRRVSSDDTFLVLLPLIEEGARDERNFVKKGVNWALRSIGRRSPVLNIAAVALARRLALSKDPAPRWVGKDALRELTGLKASAKPSIRAKGAPAKQAPDKKREERRP